MAKANVIIPTHNYVRFLDEAIHSVLNWTFGEFGLIVADDGSTENTREETVNGLPCAKPSGK